MPSRDLFDIRSPNPPLEDVVTTMREPRHPGYECSDTATELLEASGNRGRLLQFEPAMGQWTVRTAEEGGSRIVDFVYHTVFTDDRYVYDPTLSGTPIPKGDFLRIMRTLNPGVRVRVGEYGRVSAGMGDLRAVEGGIIALRRAPTAPTAPAGTPAAPTAAPADQAWADGVDFSSLELRYVADTSTEDSPAMSYAFRAQPGATTADPAVGMEMVSEASDALFVWLTLPPSAFIVNLNPSEPSRIIDPRLGRTDAGRILLEADLQMKKTVAALIHPDTELGQRYWDAIQDTDGILCLSLRQWIVPGEAVVHADGGELYILDAPLDVMAEAQYLELDGVAACPGQAPQVTAHNEETFRSMILPLVEEAVNSAPQYAALRRVYLSRVAAQWYRERALSGPTAFSDLVDSGDADPWTSDEPWDSSAIFQEYVRSIRDGEFDITRETVEGTHHERATYVFGGVDFTDDIPRRGVQSAELAASWPGLRERVGRSLTEPVRGADAGDIWLGAGTGPAVPVAGVARGVSAAPQGAPAEPAAPRYLLAMVVVLVGVLLVPALRGRRSR